MTDVAAATSDRRDGGDALSRALTGHDGACRWQYRLLGSGVA